MPSGGPRLIDSLLSMRPAAYRVLEERFHQIESFLVRAVTLPTGDAGPPYTITLAEQETPMAVLRDGKTEGSGGAKTDEPKVPAQIK